MSMVLSLSLASLARAEDGDGLGKLNPFRDLKVERQGFKDSMKADREAFKAKIDADRKAFMDDLKTKRETFFLELKAKKEAWKTANKAMKTRFCEAVGNMVTVKFTMAIEQLGNFQTKAGVIIDQLNGDGKDTSLASESLDLSKQKLEDAKTKLASVKDSIPTECTDVTPDQFAEIKGGAREAKDLLKESREALHQSIREIMKLKGEDKDTESNDDNNE